MVKLDEETHQRAASLEAQLVETMLIEPSRCFGGAQSVSTAGQRVERLLRTELVPVPGRSCRRPRRSDLLWGGGNHGTEGWTMRRARLVFAMTA
jgi:hypothetical protein